MPSLKTLRIVTIVGGLLLTAFGFFCLTDMPRQIILVMHLGSDEIINVETVVAIILAGAVSVIFGWISAWLALLWPEQIERALALPRAEFLFAVSLFGTNILFFFALALGRGSMGTYSKSFVILLVGVVLFFLEGKTGRPLARVYGAVFSRPVAFVGYVAASLYFLTLRFPLATWSRFLFSRDYPMFQYTIWLDFQVLKQGYLYGWEPYFSGGYPTFLNLRSLLIPYLPFAWLPPALGFHLMIAVTYVSVPFLCYRLAKELSDDRDMAVLSGWAGVGVMTGFMWHILNWGMMPTFTAIPFMMLALIFFVRALKGSRWGIFLCALFWAPLCYIHLGHAAHTAIVLFIVTVIWTFEERSLRAGFALARATIVTLLFSAPFLLEFLRFREHIILNNFYSYPSQGMLRLFLLNVAHSIPTLQWHWSESFEAVAFADWSYLGLFTVFFLVVVYLVGAGERGHRRVGLIYAGALLVALLSFVPKLELSFQRILYMVPPLMALALGFWMGEAKKRGRLVPFYILILMLVFYNRAFLPGHISHRLSRSEMEVAAEVAKTPRGHFVPIETAMSFDKAIPTLAERGEFDPAVIEAIERLGGHYILFENTSSLDPYRRLKRRDPSDQAEKIRETWKFPADEIWDVHAPGFVRLATGRRLFSHPGYNPHPYYDLRDTYIASGTFDGRDLDTYGEEYFEELFGKWGIEYLVLWSDAAKNFFGGIAGYEKVLPGVHYTIYRLANADTRGVVTQAGGGEVSFPDNFTAVVDLNGVPEGSRVVVRANYFPQWRAESGGRPVELENHEGQIAFDAPRSNCVVTMHFPKRPWLFAAPALAALAGILLSIRRML